MEKKKVVIALGHRALGNTLPEQKEATKRTAKTKPVSIIEHYELPYRYNETIVKILYQTPNTLFVYWDISDKDRKKYLEQYGENFFEVTHPILIVHNDTYNSNKRFC